MTIMPSTTDTNVSEDSASGSPPYVARAAISFLEVEDDGDNDELYNQLCSTLQADSRIESIRSPIQDEHSFERPAFAALDDASVANDEESALDPANHIHAFHFRDPIVFEVRAPRRVQPHFEDFDNIPASRYWAAWDGVALVVLWQLEDFQKSGRPVDELSTDDVLDGLTPSGGLIVQKILEDAARNCGCTLTSTPCSPNCSYTFAHTGLSVEPVSFDEEEAFEQGEGESFARVVIPVLEDSPMEVVSELHSKLAFVTRIFAEMRGEGRAAVGAGRLGRYDLRKLLNLNYQRASIGAQPLRNTLKARWVIRRWRRTSRLLIARMWLTLATLDRARQNWSRLKYIYDDAAIDNNRGIVFNSEYEHEVHGTSEVDASEVRSALERITNTPDSRALILSTGVGAVVGAVIGAIVGHLA